MVRAVRGAITVDDNDKEEILSRTEVLLKEIIDTNHMVQEDMISIIFTVTADLDKVFPAVAARHLGITDVPLMCMQEIPVPGSLPKCVRILLHFNTDKSNSDILHQYLRGATVLRPDLSNKKND